MENWTAGEGSDKPPEWPHAGRTGGSQKSLIKSHLSQYKTQKWRKTLIGEALPPLCPTPLTIKLPAPELCTDQPGWRRSPSAQGRNTLIVHTNLQTFPYKSPVVSNYESNFPFIENTPPTLPIRKTILHVVSIVIKHQMEFFSPARSEVTAV